MVYDAVFIWTNLYNTNTKNDQLTTFSKLTNMLQSFNLTKNKLVILAGYCNSFLDWSLEAKGGNPCLKKQSRSKLLHIKNKLNLQYVIFGKSQILKQNNILLGNNSFYSKTLRLHFYFSEFP